MGFDVGEGRIFMQFKGMVNNFCFLVPLPDPPSWSPLHVNEKHFVVNIRNDLINTKVHYIGLTKNI